jgi:hypothetical protein
MGLDGFRAMAGKKNKNPWVGLIIGPAMIAFSVAGLWKNEHRFDYHKAARKTVPVDLVRGLQPDQIFSYTGTMNRGLTMKGNYVESFTGYLTVRRSAEIYAWHEEEDDDGTSWSLQWMSHVESNSRNSGVVQQLSSHRYLPRTFQTGDLAIDTDRIEFVDPLVRIAPGSLVLSPDGKAHNLHVQGEYLFLSKGATKGLGDERLSYRGLPVPDLATYFGRYGGERAVAHQAAQREGIINSMIHDTGVLHHLVAGGRDRALLTMKKHIQRLKMIVRGVGTLVNVLGWVILFSVFTRFLIHIPALGRLIQQGAGLLGLILGLTLSLLTIGAAYLTSHPLLLAVILAGAVGVIFLLKHNARQSQQTLRSGLEREVGHSLTSEQIKELQFTEMVRLAGADGQTDVAEIRYLHDWARHQGWNDTEIANLIQQAQLNPYGDGRSRATRDHLLQLIRLALADGNLEEREMRTIRKAARDNGFHRNELSRMIQEARQLGAPA